MKRCLEESAVEWLTAFSSEVRLSQNKHIGFSIKKDDILWMADITKCEKQIKNMMENTWVEQLKGIPNFDRFNLLFKVYLFAASEIILLETGNHGKVPKG